MGLVINTNVSALTSAAALNKSGDSLATSMERLSTGKEINSAADNAAGKAISTNMTKQINMLEQGINNAKDGSNLLATMDSAASEIENMTQRMAQLAMQATNDTYSSEDKGLLDTEYQQLVQEIDRVSGNTEFNSTNLINGSSANINLQVTENSNIVLAGQDLTASTLGLTGTGLDSTGDDGRAAAVVGAATGTADLTGVTATGTALSVTYTDANGVGKKVDIDLFDAGLNLDFATLGAGTPAAPNVNGGLQALEDGLNAELKKAGLDSDIEFRLSEDSTGKVTTSIVEKNAEGGTVDLVMTGTALGLTSASDEGFAASLKDPAAALAKIGTAITSIIDARTSFGAQINRLDYTATALEDASINTSAARSQIEDADFAKETTNLARAKVLQNAGIAMLQQANSQTSNVEQLLR